MILGRYFVLYLPIYFILISIVLVKEIKNPKILAITVILFLIFINSNSIESLNGKRTDITTNIIDVAQRAALGKNEPILILKFDKKELNIEKMSETKKDIYSYKKLNLKNKKEDCFYIKANNVCIYRYLN